ncbi:hypothetical protein [Allorhodopirellula heiligendammensis]|uniref:Uncharacterized protein n=1 Tax=Allorhodopirellula heiligendammensis TaxID=2714739 RepID=A0A5C6C3U0_9BACT|nr:hypothetical protein [Allorhodopirellula heiligendammensis]TWU18186.1 hypothetical protein Poly21_03410 [Allorhodopirellula heiligendammensis]
MFAPADIPSFIQTVHGLEYKVTRSSRHDEIKQPKRSRKTGRTTTKKKSSKPQGAGQGS